MTKRLPDKPHGLDGKSAVVLIGQASSSPQRLPCRDDGHLINPRVNTSPFKDYEYVTHSSLASDLWDWLTRQMEKGEIIAYHWNRKRVWLFVMQMPFDKPVLWNHLLFVLEEENEHE